MNKNEIIKQIKENLREAIDHIPDDNVEGIEPVRASLELIEDLSKIDDQQQEIARQQNVISNYDSQIQHLTAENAKLRAETHAKGAF